MHLFRSTELRAWLEGAGLEILNLGTHLIAVARRR